MILIKLFYYILTLIILYIFSICGDCRSIPHNFHSDAIVTSWPTNETKIDKEENEPGWMRKQLLKFGKVASRIGNSMGTHATKITSAVDKICEIVKTVIPLLAAVCHVGQFKFCTATTEAPGELTQALSPTSLDLNIQD